MLPVVLCGGAGTRLWPLSRQHYPKQFLALDGERTLLQQTLMRLDDLDSRPALVVCHHEHRFIVAEQLRELSVSDADIILEPVAKNTAPAIAVAAFHALKNDDDALLLVLPADHLIKNTEAFHAAIAQAEVLARDDKLVTFGVVADKAETGYGYIKKGNRLADLGFAVEAFVEKPDLETAEAYLISADYLWNSGMFMFKAQCYLAALKAQRPDLYAICEAAVETMTTGTDFLRLDESVFSRCAAESVDYAVMENTRDAVVVPLDAQWSDLGSWSALWEISEKDPAGNAIIGDVTLHDVRDCYCHASSKLLTAVGVDNLVIIETADAIMVSSKDRVQDVKQIVDRLTEAARPEATVHRQAERPWGSYDCIDQGERFQVKRIVVKPGAALSLQIHHHRAEHWIVVKGTAKVSRGDEVFFITENQSSYIPMGVKHRLENPGVLPLEMIEVQSGSYLGEDDIVRFDDSYGRY